MVPYAERAVAAAQDAENAVRALLRDNSGPVALAVTTNLNINFLRKPAPGDLIATGTPVGVGLGFKPPRFLKPGDTVRCEIDRIGAIQATMVAED